MSLCRCARARCSGIYGFMGSGQLELARALFGKLPAERGTHARCAARAARLAQHRRRAPRRARLRAGKPAHDAVRAWSRCSRTSRSASSSASRGSGCKPGAERAIADRQVRSLQIRPPLGGPPARHALRRQPAEGGAGEVADPSARSAAAERADARHGCRRQGRRAEDRARRCATRASAIVVVSTEPETVLSLADRILVMKRGRIVREFAGEVGQQGPPAGGRMNRHPNATDVATAPPAGSWLRSRLRNIAPFATLLLLVAFFSVASPSFRDARQSGQHPDRRSR